MNKTYENSNPVGKEGNGRQISYRWSRHEIVSAASELLRSGGSSARREIVRVTLELDRLLGEGSR